MLFAFKCFGLTVCIVFFMYWALVIVPHRSALQCNLASKDDKILFLSTFLLNSDYEKHENISYLLRELVAH